MVLINGCSKTPATIRDVGCFLSQQMLVLDFANPWPTVGDATSWARQTFVGWGYLSSTLIAFKDLSNEMSQIFRSFPTQNHTIFDEMWFFIRLLGGEQFWGKNPPTVSHTVAGNSSPFEPRKKKLLSIESWLFNRDPCNDLWNNPYVYKCRHIL